MRFTFNHTNLNVCDLEASLAFYQRALGLAPVREHTADDGPRPAPKHGLHRL